MTFELNRKPITSFVSISLTDIVLLLLIFFLLSSSFVMQPGIKVKLPKAVSGETQRSDQILITLLQNGDIYLNQKRTSRAGLGAEIRRLLGPDRDRVVVLRADRTVSLENAVAVIDIAKIAGAERFLIATRPEE